MYDDLPGLFIGLLLGVVDDLLLHGQGPRLRFLPEAFYQLAPGLFGCQGGNLFKAADMLFLVLFQFSPLQVDDLYLPGQVLLDGIIVLGLLVEIFQLLIDTLLFLLDPGLPVVHPPVLFQHLLVMFRLQLDKFFLGFQQFFLFQVFCSDLGIADQFFCLQLGVLNLFCLVFCK